MNAEPSRRPLAELRPLPPRGHVASLTDISEAMGTDKSPKEILALITQAAYSITRASSASLMLVEPGREVLRVEFAEGFTDKRIYSTRLKVGQGVTGWVAESGVPLRIGNVTKDPRYVRVQKGLRSELAVPLKIRNRVIGVISVDSTRLNHFTAEDEALLLALAAHSARVIQTTRLFEETRRRAEELRLLIESSRVLSGILDLQQVLEKLVEMTAQFWHAPVAAVFLAAEDGRTLTLAAAHGGSDAFRRLPPLPVAGTLWDELLGGREESVAVEDLEARLQGAAGAVAREAGLGALLAVPLAVKSRTRGVLCVFERAGRKFEPDERRLLAGLARSAALAFENAQVHGRILALETELRRSEKSALLVELAAALAHEIRNPLTSIKILFDSLLHSEAIREDSAGDAAMIERQLVRLESIVNGYLEGARAHASTAKHKPLDLNAVVDEALLLLAGSAHEGTRMVCLLHPDELKVRGDATQLSQVVYNLVLNALQSVTQNPGSGGSSAGRGSVEIKSGRQDGGAVCLEISDDGPGLAPEIKERLFQPFASDKKQGVGLGLSIVKRIVEAHGGRIEVFSPRPDLGRGATFRVTLPAESA